MKNSGTLLNRKYRSLLASSLALTASVYLAGIVDSMMVGQLLGTEALSAISLTSPVLFLKEILPSIFVFGGNTLALMYKGRRENELANRVYTLSLLMGLLLSGGL
ncbi:MAG: MATE family efflux transporter, partial [bacterium]